MLCINPLLGSGVQFGNTKIMFNGVATIGAAGGIFAIFLGYQLFMKGIVKGKGNLVADTKIGKLAFSGTGPGLFFMAFGSLILVAAIVMSVQSKD
jgi:hypothetical protein